MELKYAYGYVRVSTDRQEESIIYKSHTNQQRNLFDIARHLNSLDLRTLRNKPFERRSIEYIL